nr:dynein axonemal intermediate chain 2-like [Parasteatoda tepidariorum]
MICLQVNTTSKSTWSTGMDHKMGGWPIEVDPRYEDQVWRYKKKIYKEEDFINSIRNMADVNTTSKSTWSTGMDHKMGGWPIEVDPRYEDQVWRDTCEKPRKVTDISWSLDGSKVAGAYAVDEVVDCRKFYSDCFIWDIDNCNVPYCTINSDTSLRVVEYSPSDLELLAGGCSTGQIGLWDSRIGGRPYYVTSIATSHAEDVTDIKWIYSKNGLVFFSASTDGKIICWDIRNMDYPSLVVDLNEGLNDCSSSDRITCLEYNTCLPHRFMMGTIRGKILSCNRKYTQPKEMIAASYSAKYSNGPVLKIQRNSFLPKVFTSCGTWGVKVWAEDITSSPILNLVPQTGYVTDAAWSNSRSSLLLMTKTTGHIELWDILLARQSPLISFKVATEGLSSLQYKQNSNQIACGTPKGCIHLLEVPEYSTFPSKPEKNLLSSMIEREYKREKLLENMTKEQLLRQSEETENDNITLSKSADYTRVTRQSAITNVYERPINVQEIMDDFASDFDSYLQDSDGDQEEDEKPFFDFQTVDVLKYMSGESSLVIP